MKPQQCRQQQHNSSKQPQQQRQGRRKASASTHVPTRWKISHVNRSRRRRIWCARFGECRSTVWLWRILRWSPIASGSVQSDVQAVGWTEFVDDAWHPKPTSRGTSTKSWGTRPSATTSITTRSRLRAAVVTTWGFGEVQGDARGRDAVRAEPSRVRSSRS